MSFERVAQAVLTDWREVESEIEAVTRRITQARPLLAELDALHAEANRLRDEYQWLVIEAARDDRPPLPPFRDPGEP